MNPTLLQAAARKFGRRPDYCQMLTALRARKVSLVPIKDFWLTTDKGSSARSYPNETVAEAIAGLHLQVLDRDPKGVVKRVGLTPDGEKLAEQFLRALRGIEEEVDVAGPLAKIIEQVGDESLLDASYTLEDLRDRLLAGFGRHGIDFIALPGDKQEWALSTARTELETEWGLVQTPEDE